MIGAYGGKDVFRKKLEVGDTNRRIAYIAQ